MGRRVQLHMRWQWSLSTSVLNLAEGQRGENRAESKERNLGNNDIVPLRI
jgi:hypothetical protein